MAKKKYKKYKQKYTTSDRLDMSKGGRVNYQVGGLNKRDERSLDKLIENSSEHVSLIKSVMEVCK